MTDLTFCTLLGVMLQSIHVDSYVNSAYVLKGSSFQFITSQKLDVLFWDNICLCINSDSKHSMLNVTYDES